MTGETESALIEGRSDRERGRPVQQQREEDDADQTKSVQSVRSCCSLESAKSYLT